MTEQELRHGTGKLVMLVAGVATGIWLLFLFVLAIAWDPLDRRLGFYARRRAARLATLDEEAAGTL